MLYWLHILLDLRYGERVRHTEITFFKRLFYNYLDFKELLAI